MIEKKQDSGNKLSADWLMRGSLARIGSTVDKLTGRQWSPSNSLATSGLIERLKRLLDAEAKEVPGKGRVAPHNIKLKMQWDKFSTDGEESLAKLETELLAAAVDHINDSLYYTFAPLRLEVKTDYFTEGVKFFVSFDKFGDEEEEAVALNVTLPGVRLSEDDIAALTSKPAGVTVFNIHCTLNGSTVKHRLEFQAGERRSIGRTAGNDVVIDDPSVSKFHASLAATDGELLVADTGSTNGTFVNGRRISYGKATRLSDTDIVKFGTVVATFERLSPEAVVEEKIESSEAVAEHRSNDSAMPAADDTVKIETLDEPAE